MAGTEGKSLLQYYFLLGHTSTTYVGKQENSGHHQKVVGEKKKKRKKEKNDEEQWGSKKLGGVLHPPDWSEIHDGCPQNGFEGISCAEFPIWLTRGHQ